ncbi:hypothetical protein D5F01_LYC09292 [Larimichthys crocea]|uniref:C-type lectin domain-containing protein n=1 Tax=Larimichthys crocea TaxID=215358 RepID=A0A6G0IKZ1_LARCR|nr:hypothetical protein D5F01_LYC09292 [Larimichthys crocea]
MISNHHQVRRLMPWIKAREFCQRHYIDLAVLSTEEQYFTLLNSTAASRFSFWLGLQRQSTLKSWMWVNGQELSYDHWYKRNYKEGNCASLESIFKKDEKLLARCCDELHMFVCHGPVSPQPVMIDSVGSGHVTLSWNVSAFMQMIPHSYNVTTCTNTCETLFYPYTDGSVFMNISISNLTSATEYFMEISAFVVRPDSFTGGNTTLQSYPTALHVQTVDSGVQSKVINVLLKSLKFTSLVPSLWILCCILKKHKSPFLYEFKESDRDTSEELSTEETIIDLIPERTRAIG